jgi:hypothetical protein
MPGDLRPAHHRGRLQERGRCGEQDVRRLCGLLVLPVWVLLAHHHRQRLLQRKCGRRGQLLRAAVDSLLCAGAALQALQHGQTYTAIAPRTLGCRQVRRHRRRRSAQQTVSLAVGRARSAAAARGAAVAWPACETHAHGRCTRTRSDVCLPMLASVHARGCRVACTCSLLTRGSARMRCARDDCPLWCCAAFALGTTSSTACPASYALLDTFDACKSAAGAASKTYTVAAHTYYPYGCYWHTITGSVYYNANAAGAGNVYAQPLCAGAVPTPRGSRACTLAKAVLRCCKCGQCVRAIAVSWSPAQTHTRTVNHGGRTLARLHSCGRCGGCGDSADVQPSGRYLPRTR